MKLNAFLAILVSFLFASCGSVPTVGPVNPATAPVSLDFPNLEAAAPRADLSLKTVQDDWYRDQNFYHIWVASFSDSDGNGLGDIRGIIQKLDYLKGLGVTGLWLSPFFKSASNNSNLHGYNVLDFYHVDSRLGTDADVDELVRTAHQKNLRVIFDFVPNHVSNRHPWFKSSRISQDGKRDWFIWTTHLDWNRGRDWSGNEIWYDGGTAVTGERQYYYGIFGRELPDLNFRSSAVRLEMAHVVQFWLNRGFDGFRADAVRYLLEDPSNGVNGVQAVSPLTLKFFQNLRQEVVDPYRGLGYAKFMICENWTDDVNSLNDFLESDHRKAFDAVLDFPFGHLAYQAVLGGSSGYQNLEAYWSQTATRWEARGESGGTFLNNHDNYQSRPVSAFSGDKLKVILAAVLQYTGLGVPIWYYGNEILMPGENRGDDRQFRQMMDWQRLPGFENDSKSVFREVQALMELRTARSSLRRGAFTPIPVAGDQTVGFIRTYSGQATVVILHVGSGTVTAKWNLPTGWQIANALLGGGVATTAIPTTLTLGPYGFQIYDLK